MITIIDYENVYCFDIDEIAIAHLEPIVEPEGYLLHIETKAGKAISLAIYSPEAVDQIKMYLFGIPTYA